MTDPNICGHCAKDLQEHDGVHCPNMLSSFDPQALTSYAPCKNCRRGLRSHMPDGACLFEATSFEPTPLPISSKFLDGALTRDEK